MSDNQSLATRIKEANNPAVSIAPPSPYDLPRYHYQPLPDGYIRLIQLMPHREQSAPLRLLLTDYGLLDRTSGNGPHLYEALSYTWGSSEKIRTVYTETGYLFITENLYVALLRLRNHAFPRIIWADGICINQDDNEEKYRQIKIMAMTYTKAARVIVWLGEAATRDSQQRRALNAHGDAAIEAIQAAAEKKSSSTEIDETSRKSISILLQQTWFRRIWVLQEISAAGQVSIMTHSREINGCAFSRGLNTLNFPFDDPEVESLVHSIAYLLEGSIIRSRYFTAQVDDHFSLDIGPLGQLIDMYHTREASDRRDKIYALLGMSSDNHKPGALSVNYETSWKRLLSQLIKSNISAEGSVDTWDDLEIAAIRTRCYLVGTVWEIVKAKSEWGQTQTLHIRLHTSLRYLGERGGYGFVTWTILTTRKAVQPGDAICVLQGAANPSLVRASKDFWDVISISIMPLKEDPRDIKFQDVMDFVQSQAAFSYNILLIWDWNKSWPRFEKDRDIEYYLKSLVPAIDAKLEDHWDKAARFHILGLMLMETSYRNEHAAWESLQNAIKLYGTSLGIVIPQTLLNSSAKEPLPLEKLSLVASILDEFEITDQVFQAAFYNKKHAPEMVKLLLSHRDDRSIVAERLLTSAMDLRGDNCWAGELVEILLDHIIEKSVITEDVLLEAIKAWGYKKVTILRLLLAKQPDPSIITENVLAAAVSAERFTAVELTTIILKQRIDTSIITEKVLTMAVWQQYGTGVELTNLLLSQEVDRSIITAEVLLEAAGTPNVVPLLLEYGGGQVVMTPEVLARMQRFANGPGNPLLPA
ncbi:HET domain protein [Xylariaceae sp. FL0255]|nr:HET domain protein [Xylariaceae sp. FL0255]